jgi:predicted RNA binding protein YcfA (HicA-like mRNA interferase family)
MAQQLPSLRSAEVVRALERAGFQTKRQTGSHLILTKPGLRRPVVVPIHRRELPRGTVLAIIRQAGITPEQFMEHL